MSIVLISIITKGSHCYFQLRLNSKLQSLHLNIKFCNVNQVPYKYVELILWIDIHEILFLQQDSAFNEIRKLDDKFEARVCGSFRRGEKIHLENTA